MIPFGCHSLSLFLSHSAGVFCNCSLARGYLLEEVVRVRLRKADRDTVRAILKSTTAQHTHTYRKEFISLSVVIAAKAHNKFATNCIRRKYSAPGYRTETRKLSALDWRRARNEMPR